MSIGTRYPEWTSWSTRMKLNRRLKGSDVSSYLVLRICHTGERLRGNISIGIYENRLAIPSATLNVYSGTCSSLVLIWHKDREIFTTPLIQNILVLIVVKFRKHESPFESLNLFRVIKSYIQTITNALETWIISN